MYDYDRRKTASEPFKDLFTFDSFMFHEGEKLGWKNVPAHGFKHRYIKQFGGIWYAILYSDHLTYGETILISPTTYPRETGNMTEEEKEAFHAKTDRRVSVKGETIESIERVVQDLVKEYKSFKTYQRKDISGLRFRDAVGEEAVAKWRAKVEEVLLTIINQGAARGMDFDTEVLVEDVVDNHNLKIYGLTRGEMARMIRALLDKLAKAGKILKDTNEARKPVWVGNDFVSRPRY